MVGVDGKEVLAGGGVEIETARTPGQARALARKARDSAKPQAELRNFVIDGARRTLQIHEIPGLPDGGLAGFAQDATDAEEARAELRRYVDANSDVFNKLSGAIAIFGADKQLAFHNEAFAKLWRLDDDWLATSPGHGEVLDMIRENRLLPEQANYPAYKAQELAQYTDLLETTEAYLYLPDGRVLHRLVSPHPLGGLMYIDEDVTDRLALERSYNTLIDVQQETLDNLHEAIAVFGGDGRLKLFNQNYLSLWSLDGRFLETEPHVSEIVDRCLDQLSFGRDREEVRNAIIAQVTERNARMGRMERGDDTVIDYAEVPLPDGNMLYTYVDVSDSVRAELALRERNEALEAADRLKTEFMSNVSYALRTPLNVIIGFAEMLHNEYFGSLNEKQREYSSDIIQASNQLMGVVNDILDLARIEAGMVEINTETFDLHQALSGVITLAQERAHQQELELSLTCADDIGGIEADERSVKQATLHLLSNALKFTPPGGKVTVGASRESDRIKIWVADTGIGIAEQDQADVFETFGRGSRRVRRQGVGLGLSLVQRLIALNGGWLDLESREGVGTRVTCHLPLDRDAEQETATAD